jgi:hypothetical protein
MNETDVVTTVEAPAVKPVKTRKPKKTKSKPVVELRLPQVRILRAIASEPLTRADTARKAGFSEGSGTMPRFLNGSKANGVKSMFSLGLVEDVTVDVAGKEERLLRITPAGKRALRAELNGSTRLPKMRDHDACVNRRYGKPLRKPASGKARKSK